MSIRHFLSPPARPGRLARGLALAAAVTALSALSAPQAAAQWITPPSVFNEPLLIIGGFGVRSGYTGGEYLNAFGERCTASVSMRSTVVDLGGGKWQYSWTLENAGTGDFVQYLAGGPGRGPNFLLGGQVLAGSRAAPCDYTADYIANNPGLNPQVDGRIGGPPVLGTWGGRWNPETGSLDAQLYLPTPEPASLALVAGGLVALGVLTRRRRL